MPLATDQTPTQWYAGKPARPSSSVAAISLRLRDTTRAGGAPEDQTVTHQPSGQLSGSGRRDQQMLWVDGVGGYLVTLADQIVIGQPGVGASDGPDLPILADLSRRHARLARTGGRYVLTPYGSAKLNGKKLDGPAVIENGALIELGSVTFRLRRPHALSASAILTVESGHRTVPAADAVLLMAESCVLGPKPHSHIRCPEWRDEAILFRGPGGLVCRSSSVLTVDGRPTDGAAPVTPGHRIEGQDFALSVEQVGEA